MSSSASLHPASSQPLTTYVSDVGYVFPTPRAIRLLVGVLSGVLLLSAVGALIVSIVVPAKPAWFLTMFEAVVLITAILGVVFATGRFDNGPGIALVSFAGVIGVATFLGFVGSRANFDADSYRAFVLARMGAAGLLSLCAAWIVLRRRPRESLPYLIKGLVVAGLFVALSVAAWVYRAQLSALPDMLRAAVAVFAFGLWVGLLSTGAHLLIRAFEVTIPPLPPMPPALAKAPIVRPSGPPAAPGAAAQPAGASPAPTSATPGPSSASANSTGNPAEPATDQRPRQ